MRLRVWMAATAVAMLLALNGGTATADTTTGTFTIRHNYGPVGTIIDVLSGDNCAINERFSTVFTTLDGQELARDPGSAGLAIGLVVTVPDVPLGDYQVQAACIDPTTGATNRTYVPVPFKITGGALRFRTTDTSVLPGTTITATPDSPCPTDYIEEPRLLIGGSRNVVGIRPLGGSPAVGADGWWKPADIYVRADAYIGGDSLRITCVGNSLDTPFVEYQPIPLTVERPTATGYLALGDSYSAGEGLPKFKSGTDTKTDTCHRSSQAYPQLVYNFGLPDTAWFTFKACSGAIVDSFVTTFKSEPPQLNWVSPDTRYITLSIGGNDVGFADVLKDCIYGIGRLVDGGTGSPGCRFRHDRAVRDRIAALGSDQCYLESCLIVPSLTHLYEQIQARAPQAIIRVVTYPKLFTQNPGSRVAVYTKVAGKSALYIDGEDAKWINQMGDLLNGRIAYSAQLAAEGPVTISSVDPNFGSLPSFYSHGVGDPDPWIFGVVPTHSEYSFHPTAQGQCALAAHVTQSFRVNPAGIC